MKDRVIVKHLQALSRRAAHGAPQRQRGASLMVMMIMLVMVVIIAVSGSLLGVSDERMARNFRDQTLAIQAAEFALRNARNDLAVTREINGATGFTTTCDLPDFKGLCLPATTGQHVWTQWIEDQNRSVRFGEFAQDAAGFMPSVATLPRYMVEALPDTEGQSLRAGPQRWAYRITAVGYGALPGTRVVIQELVRNPQADLIN